MLSVVYHDACLSSQMKINKNQAQVMRYSIMIVLRTDPILSL